MRNICRLKQHADERNENPCHTILIFIFLSNYVFLFFFQREHGMKSRLNKSISDMLEEVGSCHNKGMNQLKLDVEVIQEKVSRFISQLSDISPLSCHKDH